MASSSAVSASVAPFELAGGDVDGAGLDRYQRRSRRNARTWSAKTAGTRSIAMCC
jgi:hypothetical protein